MVLSEKRIMISVTDVSRSCSGGTLPPRCCSGGEVVATAPVPLTFGVWTRTPPVELQLQKGVQTLRIQTPTAEHKRGMAVRSFQLKAE